MLRRVLMKLGLASLAGFFTRPLFARPRGDGGVVSSSGQRDTLGQTGAVNAPVERGFQPPSLKKKLVILSLSANSPSGVRSFYETLFGLQFAESLTDQYESYHAPIDENGIDFTINPTFPGGQVGVVPYFAVDNLDSAVNEARTAGGRVVWGPANLPISPGEKDEYKQRIQEFYPGDATGVTDWDTLGRAALLTDPAGSPVGLVQLAQHVEGRFKAGKHKRNLDATQQRVHTASLALGEKHRQRRGPR